MKLKDKLFNMVNDQPFLQPVGIHIPEFAALWDADKSEEKIQYAQELAYIYHMWEYDSPYYDRKNKEEEIIKDFIGKKGWKPAKRVLAAFERYKQLDESPERLALDAAIASCNSIASDLINLKRESSEVAMIFTEIEQEILRAESIFKKVDLLNMKLKIQEQRMSIAKMISDIMPRLEKTIETVLNLRKKVTASVYKGENTDAIVGDYLYEKIMDEIDYEQSQNEH